MYKCASCSRCRSAGFDNPPSHSSVSRIPTGSHNSVADGASRHAPAWAARNARVQGCAPLLQRTAAAKAVSQGAVRMQCSAGSATAAAQPGQAAAASRSCSPRFCTRSFSSSLSASAIRYHYACMRMRCVIACTARLIAAMRPRQMYKPVHARRQEAQQRCTGWLCVLVPRGLVHSHGEASRALTRW